MAGGSYNLDRFNFEVYECDYDLHIRTSKTSLLIYVVYHFFNIVFLLEIECKILTKNQWVKRYIRDGLPSCHGLSHFIPWEFFSLATNPSLDLQNFELLFKLKIIQYKLYFRFEKYTILFIWYFERYVRLYPRHGEYSPSW